MPNSLIEILPRQGLSICQMTVLIKLDYFSLTQFSWSNHYLQYIILQDYSLACSTADLLRRYLKDFQKKTDNILQKRNNWVGRGSCKKSELQKFILNSNRKFACYHFSTATGSSLNCSICNWNCDSSTGELPIRSHLICSKAHWSHFIFQSSSI